MADDCKICSLESADDSVIVFRDELWAAQVAPGFEVPGWFFLRTRRHAHGITGLSAEESETFGDRAKRLIGAVARATGAEATYMLMFGENFPHFHILITARGSDVPNDRRGGDILKLRDERLDSVRARELVPLVRQLYIEDVASAPCQ